MKDSTFNHWPCCNLSRRNPFTWFGAYRQHPFPWVDVDSASAATTPTKKGNMILTREQKLDDLVAMSEEVGQAREALRIMNALTAEVAPGEMFQMRWDRLIDIINKPK